MINIPAIRLRRGFWVALAASLSLAACGYGGEQNAPADSASDGATGDRPKAVRIGLVAKSLGNNFFIAVEKGGQEAARELGNVEVVFNAPSQATAEGQIEVLNGLIAQRVDAIAVSANDPDALVPTLKKAMQRGIQVISYDSSVAQEGRSVHLSPSSDQLIGETCIKLAADAAPSGQIAIVSATPTSTNQNAWIVEMKKAIANYPGLEIVSVVYGDDAADKSYREATALLKKYPELKVIVSPSSVGIVATAKAVEDAGKSGKVYVTGLGLPSELQGHVNKGTVKSFAIWNPIDLGYATIQLAVRLARGEAGGAHTSVSIGRLGTVSFDASGAGPMGKPFEYNQSNIAEYAQVF